MPTSAVTPDDVVRHIFRYLAEVGESRTKPVRTHDDARHQVWFADLPAQFGSFLTDAVPGDTPLWLRADRPVRHEPPAPPLPLAHWLGDREIRDSARETPPSRGRRRTYRRTRSPPREAHAPGTSPCLWPTRPSVTPCTPSTAHGPVNGKGGHVATAS